ncbi:cellulose binding domain-containing protein [Nonomuraea sp. CA-143628]|uniref:cellulose binding domain-containing protein n=1 Tax=Nonomuraea sp. CA-143628 TaxID=3239997 RepID=UPI003D919F47
MRIASRLSAAIMAGLLLIATLGGPARATPATMSRLLMGPCLVNYSVTTWPGGFSADVAITNHIIPPPNGTLTFILPSSQQITQTWDATATQSGQQATLVLPPWHPNIGMGETYKLGFNATEGGVYTNAFAFRLAGQLCDVIYQP